MTIRSTIRMPENKRSLRRLSPMMRTLRSWAVIEQYDNVLDLSCGNGVLIEDMSRRLNLSAWGLIKKGEEPLPNAESNYVVAQPDDMPFENDQFDCVLSSHLLDREKMHGILKEVYRVLRPGGHILLVSEPVTNLLRQTRERRLLMQQMSEAGFGSISWRLSGLFGVTIAWKEKEIN